MERWSGKVAVVTGASAGIGAAVCLKLAEEGLKVVGFARRVDRVTELAKQVKNEKGQLFAVQCDVTNQEEVEKSFQWVKENVGPVQILINNAGIMKIGTCIEGDPADIRAVLDTNVLGVCVCTRAAYRQMKARGVAGHVVHVNSVAGHWLVAGDPPVFNVYSASKHALTAITEVMRREINHDKSRVKITSISPGAVKTEIAQAAGMEIPADSAWAKQPRLLPEHIADNVVYVLSTPPDVLIQELIIRPMGEAALT